MSETFFLWAPSWDAATHTLYILALQANVGTIGRGTRGMIDEMLRDLGWVTAPVAQWHVEPRVVRTPFHAQSADDEPDQEWGDVWAPSWELAIEMAPGVKVPPDVLLSARADVGTFARDATAQGTEADQYPADARVVVQCSSALIKRRIVETLEPLFAGTPLPKPSAEAREVAAALKRYDASVAHAPRRAVQVRNARRELHVCFGQFATAGEARASALGDAIEALCTALGGRTRIWQP